MPSRALLVCSPKDFPWLSRLAFAAGTGWVFSLGSDRSGSLLERASFFPDQHVPAQRGSDDLAAILYTSGTTGRSKGAMLSHGNLVSNALTLKSYWGWRTPAEGGDVLIHALPIFHVHGLFVASHGALLAGAKMLWLDRFDARVARRPAAARHRLHGRADALRAHARRARARPRGLPQHAPLHQRLGADAGRDLRGLARAHRPHHPRALRHERDRDADLEPLPGARRRAPRRHRRLPPARGRAAHPRRPGNTLGTDEVGGIEVRGPNVFRGYWRMPEKTREEFAEGGWFRTGDVGRIDARGYVTIVGRSKDLIISGGYNVYPAEVEAALNELPGVAESAVVGVPHADFGEAVVAVVVAQPGVALDGESLLATLKAKMANFKVPKTLFVVAELPRNAMGKVQKNLLREQLRAALRLRPLAAPPPAGALARLSGAAGISSPLPRRPGPCVRRSA